MTKHKKSSSKHKNRKNNSPNLKDKSQESDNHDQNLYEVKESETLGRYLVASKNIGPGEIILTDEPIVVGPCQEAKPTCIGCYADIDLKSPQNYQRCNGCGWPMCSLTCLGYHKRHGHSKEECDILSESSLKNKPASSFESFYYAITPFRCLVVKEKHQENWKILEKMESHTEKRQKVSRLWETNQKMAVDVIRNSWELKRFTEEEIHFVCGVLEVNAFEVILPIPRAQPIRALYPKAFLFAHDCVPNTCHSNGEEFQLIVRTTRTISANEIVTVSYAYSLQCTLKRRKHLQDTKFFSCSCKRCSDPTELGTYAGAIKCSTCKDGLMLPTNPLLDDSVWKCNSPKCTHEVQDAEITLFIDRLFKELDSINGNDVIGYETFLKKCGLILHESHYLCLSALHCLSQLYGKINGYLINELSDEQLERKEEICRKLIRIFGKLEPGLSKQKGILLYELHAPLMVKLRKRFESQNITKKEMKCKIKEVLKYLEESYVILSKEPKSSTEGQLAEAAKAAMTSLQDWHTLLN